MVGSEDEGEEEPSGTPSVSEADAKARIEPEDSKEFFCPRPARGRGVFHEAALRTPPSARRHQSRGAETGGCSAGRGSVRVRHLSESLLACVIRGGLHTNSGAHRRHRDRCTEGDGAPRDHDRGFAPASR